MFKFFKELKNDKKRKKYLKNLSSLERERFLLFEKYYDFPRYTEELVEFLDYKFIIPDCLSFIHQFKEIFVDEIYKFISVNPSPVIIDCGANIGTSCAYYKKIHPNSQMYAFEADPNIFNILKENLLKNNINGVELYNKAVWIKDEQLYFSCDGADGGSFFKETDKKEKVDAIRIKNFIEGFEKIDFLKLDVEGAETLIIEDCQDILHIIDNLFIEYHSFNKTPQSLDKILKILTEEGFRYYIDTINEKKTPFINRENNFLMDLQVNIFAYQNVEKNNV